MTLAREENTNHFDNARARNKHIYRCFFISYRRHNLLIVIPKFEHIRFIRGSGNSLFGAHSIFNRRLYIYTTLFLSCLFPCWVFLIKFFKNCSFLNNRAKFFHIVLQRHFCGFEPFLLLCSINLV